MDNYRVGFSTKYKSASKLVSNNSSNHIWIWDKNHILVVLSDNVVCVCAGDLERMMGLEPTASCMATRPDPWRLVSLPHD
jgi:hypothetical protein